MAALIASNAVAGTVALLASVNTPVAPAARTAGPVYQLFPAATDGGRQERYINNPNAVGSIWVTFHDTVVPAANGEGSFEVPPGGGWSGSINNQVRAVFTAAAMTITHGER